jgi:hypothetical protein
MELREVAFGTWFKSPVRRGAFGAVTEVAFGAVELGEVALGAWIKCPV